MPQNDKLFLAAQRLCLMSKRHVKDRFRPSLIELTGAGKTFEERLQEIKKPMPIPRSNIGMPPSRTFGEKNDPSEIWTYSATRGSSETRQNILNAISNDWISDNGPVDIAKIADHYAVFKHLFGDAFFYPQFDWRVSFRNNEVEENEENIVQFGNPIPASSCLDEPNVEFHLPLTPDSSKWCLVMTALDGNLTNPEDEYILWMVANLKAGDEDPLEKGNVVVPYLPPFPPRGLGYCRIAFVLYQQLHGRIENFQDQLMPTQVTSDLRSRNFSTFDWYREREDLLTPASLRFFQTVWDDSVTGIYHEILDMKEPTFEYMTPEPYRKEQLVRPPEDVAFNDYLDQYRDRKDVAEEIFSYYLFHAHNPVGARKEPPKYPNLKRYDPQRVVSWIRDEESNKALRKGKWRFIPKSY